MHRITRIDLISPDGIDWACECGAGGRCPRPIAAEILSAHLKVTEGGDPQWHTH